ncbi:mediator of DNA damage checkpoint protein 1-like, partial [Falco rusticolus]|uniref:mediator of DNA damage checkpoint protein 1-like n=1 Tax=Falco rusticolus TaxID=120794 RepID=UPI001886A6E7
MWRRGRGIQMLAVGNAAGLPAARQGGGVGTTNPDVAAAARERRRNPEVVSDTDVEDDELSQHVPHPKTPPNFWKDPAVVMETPNPDVGGRRHGSAASGGDSDTDVEEGNISLAEAEQVAPTPDVGGLRSRIGFQKPPPPDVGGLLRGSDTDVEETGPFPLQSSSPLSPRPGGDGDAAGGPGDTESVTEEDPNLFLEATQMFLPPADEAAPPSWDPEEPTQLFCPHQEEEEEEEQPPPRPSPTPPTPSPSPQPPPGGTGAPPQGESPTGGGEAPPQPAPGQDPRGCGQRGWSRRKGRSQSGKRRSTPWLRPLTVQPPPPGPPPPTGTTGHKGASASEATPPLKATPPAHRSRPFTEERTGGRGEATRGRGAPAPPPGGLWLRPPQGVVASPGMEVALRTLRGSMGTSIFDCTHLVTDRIRRTVKFLCAVARGIPIVTPEWLEKSARSGRVLAPGPFLVRDKQQERHFGFSLAQALARARCHPLLQGYEVHVTPNVRPEPEHMRDIVTCSGGTFLPTMPRTYKPRRLVISCAADAGCWAPALSAHLPLASAELLLTGLLRQQLQLQPFLLRPPAPTPPRAPPA